MSGNYEALTLKECYETLIKFEIRKQMGQMVKKSDVRMLKREILARRKAANS